MLTISDTRPAHDCQGFSRRDFLRIGSLGIGGLSPGLLTRRALGEGTASLLTGKSVVLLFLQGGPPTDGSPPPFHGFASARCSFWAAPTSRSALRYSTTFRCTSEV